MSKVAIQGNASGTGTFTIAAPNSNTDRTLTLPDEAGAVLINGTSSNVGIGTNSPSHILDVAKSGETITRFSSTTGDPSYTLYQNSDTGSTNTDGLLVGILGNEFGYVFNYESQPLVFGTSNSERIRILGDTGALHVKVNGANAKTWGSNSNATQVIDNRADKVVFTAEAETSSYANSGIQRILCDRSGSSAYHFLTCTSGDLADDEFRLRGDGQGYADGSWNGGGADYAEYFEWADSNTSNEDRRGYTVVLDGNKVRKATDEDDASQIIGAVSATPCVIGDHADNKWSDKFLKDDFGNYIREEHNVVEWTETYTDENGVEQEKQNSYEDWNIPEGITAPDDATVLTHDDNGNRFDHRKLNPDFDPDAEYIPREKRPEWSPIGMMGKLRIRTGQPVGDRWIKMRDISDSVEEWLVR